MPTRLFQHHVLQADCRSQIIDKYMPPARLSHVHVHGTRRAGGFLTDIRIRLISSQPEAVTTLWLPSDDLWMTFISPGLEDF